MDHNLTRTTRFEAFYALGVIVAAGALLGIAVRPVGWLSSFWPANALLLGVLIRVPAWRRASGWAGAVIGYLAADLATGGEVTPTLLLTLANLASVAAGVTVLVRRPPARQLLQQPHGVLDLFVACAVGAAAATVAALYCGIHYFGLSLGRTVTTWFSAEFATHLALLPVMLTAPAPRTWPRHLPPRRRASDRRATLLAAAPVAGVLAALILGIVVDGPAALAFTIPVLLWSATRGDVFKTACLVLLATAWNLMAAGLGYLDLRYQASASDHLLSAQVSMSLAAMGPLMVAVSSRSREQQLREWEGLASRDVLTGVLSRRGFLDAAGIAMRSMRAAHERCAVLMLDLDHFKALNDRHGHAVGDGVLTAFGATLSARLRESDLAGRIGGEEFAVLLRGADVSEACTVAEDIRAATAALAVPAGEETATVTVSIGIAHSCIAHADEELTAMLLRADRALYLAKQQRNRVTVDAV